MADKWIAEAEDVVRRAFLIGNSPAADGIRAETNLGGGGLERGMMFGMAAALAGVDAPDEPEQVDEELQRLRDENAQLRGILHLDDDDTAEADS